MRGALSAGALLAVDLLGFRLCFDEVYAASAGGVNAAYFLSGQGVMGISVYFEDICNRRFINPLRFWKMLDVEYVYDHVLVNRKPLDEQAVKQARARFYLSATEVDSGDNVLIDVAQSSESVHRILKASSALPVFYNRTVMLGSTHYVDGGISDAMPIQQAIARGCTDILVLATKPEDHVSSAPGLFPRSVFYAFMGRRHPKLLDALRSSYERSNINRSLAVGSVAVAGVNVATICPTSAEMTVGRTTINREKLLAGAHTMAGKTCRLFARSEEPLLPVFRKFSP